MSNTERVVTWGLLAFIAYELWPIGESGSCGGTPLTAPSNSESTPQWVNQLAESLYGEDFSSPACGIFGRCK